MNIMKLQTAIASACWFPKGPYDNMVDARTCEITASLRKSVL